MSCFRLGFCTSHLPTSRRLLGVSISISPSLQKLHSLSLFPKTCTPTRAQFVSPAQPSTPIISRHCCFWKFSFFSLPWSRANQNRFSAPCMCEISTQIHPWGRRSVVFSFVFLSKVFPFPSSMVFLFSFRTRLLHCHVQRVFWYLLPHHGD